MGVESTQQTEDAKQVEFILAELKEFARKHPAAFERETRYYTGGSDGGGDGGGPASEVFIPSPRAAFVDALRETIGYMRARREGAASDTIQENELARLWELAGHAVADIDPVLAQRCWFKGLGWLDPEVWDRAKAKGLKIGIPDMENALQDLLVAPKNADTKAAKEDRVEKDHPNTPTPERGTTPTQQMPSWSPMVGAGFAILTFFFLMYLILGPELAPGRQNFVNLLMALSVAASAAFLGGDAAAKGSIPFFKESPVTFSVVGGIAAFIVVYLILWYTTQG